MGTPADRAAYATALQAWLRDRLADLAPDAAAKVESHPLRVPDSKRTETPPRLAHAPRMAQHPDAASIAHAAPSPPGLRALGIDPAVAATAVRGTAHPHTPPH